MSALTAWSVGLQGGGARYNLPSVAVCLLQPLNASGLGWLKSKLDAIDLPTIV